jgi:membrane protein DedA with SNARE-associated domain
VGHGGFLRETMSYTEKFLSLLHSLPEFPTYFLLGLSAYVENVFPPIPGDTIMAFGAFMVGIGKLSFFGVYISTTLGSLLGFLSLFWLGGVLGRRFFMERDYRFFRAGDLLKAEQWFERYGYLLIALNRFLPGIRSAVSLAGGLSRLRLGWVALLAFVSCAVWNLIWIMMGYLLGSNWQMIEARMSALLMKYNLAVFILLVLTVLSVVVIRRVTRNRSGKP